jgi:hypothetical protein
MPILSSDMTNSKGTSCLWHYQSKKMNPSLFVHDILTMNRDEVNTQMLKKNNCCEQCWHSTTLFFSW